MQGENRLNNADAKHIKEHHIRHHSSTHKTGLFNWLPYFASREGKYTHTCVVTLQNGCLCSNGTRKVTQKSHAYYTVQSEYEFLVRITVIQMTKLTFSCNHKGFILKQI